MLFVTGSFTIAEGLSLRGFVPSQETIMKNAIVIGAVAQDNGAYGQNGTMLWHSKLDMNFFKEATSGHTVVMGRKTWDSLPPKFRPLPNRENIVVTNDRNFLCDGAVVAHSVQEAFEKAQNNLVFFIGGHSIWYAAMEFATVALITIIKKRFEVVEGTQVAPELLTIGTHWPTFQLQDSTPLIDTMGGERVEIVFCHWEQ